MIDAYTSFGKESRAYYRKGEAMTTDILMILAFTPSIFVHGGNFFPTQSGPASKPGSIPMSNSRFTVDHVRVTSDKPFDTIAAAFMRQLGKYDEGVLKELGTGGDAKAVRAKLEALAGPSGFMLFGTQDHGRLLRLVGQKRNAIQYVIGNPLFAVEMTRHAVGASLYAPLRVLIYEADDGKTRIEYDRPSSLFGQFGDERVARMAAALDQKLADLAAKATCGTRNAKPE
jgi:uncharacterized protein (DUF302 family)